MTLRLVLLLAAALLLLLSYFQGKSDNSKIVISMLGFKFSFEGTERLIICLIVLLFLFLLVENLLNLTLVNY